MSIYLGNLTFEETIERTGFELTEEDRALWDEFHNSDAKLKGMESSFHVFDIPLCIHVRGEEAKNAILKMFASHKLKTPKGRFQVYQV